MADILVSQLTDPFRIGMMFFLLVTAIRTRDTMGMKAPLAMGVVFVAILLPMTTAASAEVARFTSIVSASFPMPYPRRLSVGWFFWKAER